ncbi:lipid II:glycine glycyltransferase FemX [Bdellovibrio svalbardensis]|uniref:Peptidoglycan bridge formation glycyltransferase FemA/FemB family protein n=1 Tax=Bdellovibrio svalbardensis TaxID=2972972 RepID=A0ABT6DKF3_9BACT|nr:peptidoglycan bridge formation glycyltransferase FemA/FemB family protein [Bdellovibrio svalbardensis]MDG0817345.1 peptidoglycan bridge formation glycyltransferase FemA/FemB family protein [Bdellovibrio svalbardensis]
MIQVLRSEPQNLGVELPILAREAYLRCKSAHYGWIVSKNFIVPFFIDKKLIFKRMVFTFEPVIHSPEGADLNFFWQEAILELKKLKLADFIFKAQSNVVLTCGPQDSVSVPWGTLEVNIHRSDEEILEACHGKHRNVIRKAIKDGVKVRLESNPEVIYQHIHETMLRQNLPYFPSQSYLTCLREELPNNVLFVIAEFEGKIQGCAVVVFDSYRAYYMYGGSVAKPYTGSLNLLHYETMKILRDKGVLVYDLVGARVKVVPGSKQEGIQNFKIRFGAEMRTGIAFRYVFNPIRYKLFNLSAKVFLALKGTKYVDPIDQIRREMQ